MYKAGESVISTLEAQRDRLTKKAKRQSEVAQATLDQANSLSKAISELKAEAK